MWHGEPDPLILTAKPTYQMVIHTRKRRAVWAGAGVAALSQATAFSLPLVEELPYLHRQLWKPCRWFGELTEPWTVPDNSWMIPISLNSGQNDFSSLSRREEGLSKKIGTYGGTLQLAQIQLVVHEMLDKLILGSLKNTLPWESNAEWNKSVMKEQILDDFA